MRSSGARSILILLTCFWAASGCYSYVSGRPGVSFESHPVQVTLTDSGSVVLASQIGPSIIFVDGILVADSGSALLLSVQSTERRDGTLLEWKGERVNIPRVLIAQVGARRFSASRTSFLAALGVAAIVAITAAFGGLGPGFGSGHSGRGSPGPQ